MANGDFGRPPAAFSLRMSRHGPPHNEARHLFRNVFGCDVCVSEPMFRDLYSKKKKGCRCAAKSRKIGAVGLPLRVGIFCGGANLARPQ